MAKSNGFFFGSTKRTSHSRPGGFESSRVHGGRMPDAVALSADQAKRAGRRCGGCR